MSSNWPTVKIDDIKIDRNGAIAIGPFGSRMKSDCYVSSGVPVIRGNNLGVGLEFRNEFVFITEEKADELGSCNVYKGDLVFPHRGSIGEVGIVEKEQRYVLSTSLMKLTCDPKKACSKFIYYFFKSNKGKYELLKNASQVGTPGIGQPLTSLRSIEVPLPPLNIQKSIARILGSLDKKIQLNQKINQTLEQIAQAIFKSWFVEFEPVKAKIAARKRWQATQPGNEVASPVCYAGELGDSAAGEDLETAMNLAAMQAISGKNREELARLQSEQPEQYAELRVTAELFPSAMQDSELGEVPEGWGPVRLERYIELAYGKALKKSSRVEGPYPVYGSGGITGSHNDFLVPGPGIVVGRKGTVGSIYWEAKDFYPIDTTYYVLVKNGCSLPFAYYLLHTLGLDGMNTDAAVPGLNRNNVYRLEVPCYSLELMERFSLTINSISKMKSASNNETQSLIELRDTLLPKLLSGELTLPATEAQEPELPKAANV